MSGGGAAAVGERGAARGRGAERAAAGADAARARSASSTARRTSAAHSATLASAPPPRYCPAGGALSSRKRRGKCRSLWILSTACAGSPARAQAAPNLAGWAVITHITPPSAAPAVASAARTAAVRAANTPTAECGSMNTWCSRATARMVARVSSSLTGCPSRGKPSPHLSRRRSGRWRSRGAPHHSHSWRTRCSRCAAPSSWPNTLPSRSRRLPSARRN
mmetsp:Transcript_8816/g.28395  ORF Transcript_8816/g.28395 Transcript_8816/m.28395 type:complete len:220 (+) Transcript_8816:1398-2057(+)